MADATKSSLWAALKLEGWLPTEGKTFVHYTIDEMQLELNTIKASKMIQATMDESVDSEPIPADTAEVEFEELANSFEPVSEIRVPQSEAELSPAQLSLLQMIRTPQQEAVVEEREPTYQEMFPDLPITDEQDAIAGLHMHTHGPNDPIRIDTQGRLWFQDEIRKPSTVRPRARRVHRIMDRGVKTVDKINDLGMVEESFEVSGDESREVEIKITLPSWQIGIYADPRLPFRVHIYNDVRGFDMRDVGLFYNGYDNVPTTVKTVYVGGDLCYDITSVREALDQEYRERVLRIGTSK